jgi:hypothetical protein
MDEANVEGAHLEERVDGRSAVSLDGTGQLDRPVGLYLVVIERGCAEGSGRECGPGVEAHDHRQNFYPSNGKPGRVASSLPTSFHHRNAISP